MGASPGEAKRPRPAIGRPAQTPRTRSLGVDAERALRLAATGAADAGRRHDTLLEGETQRYQRRLKELIEESDRSAVQLAAAIAKAQHEFHAGLFLDPGH